MTEAIALHLLRLLLAEAPGVLLWVLRKAGIVPDDSGHAPIEKMRRASDVLVTNPMVEAANAKRDPAAADNFPVEYDKPESD